MIGIYSTVPSEFKLFYPEDKLPSKIDTATKSLFCAVVNYFYETKHRNDVTPALILETLKIESHYLQICTGGEPTYIDEMFRKREETSENAISCSLYRAYKTFPADIRTQALASLLFYYGLYTKYVMDRGCTSSVLSEMNTTAWNMLRLKFEELRDAEREAEQ